MSKATRYPALYKSSPESAGFSTKKLNLVDKFIEDDVQDGFPGAALLIIKDCKIIKEAAYGYKCLYVDGGIPLSTPENMTVNTIFDIASNSKMYSTNFALMKLIFEGVLNVDDPVKKYLPKYSGEGRDKVTVRNLLTHTAGYAPEVLFYMPDNELGKEFHSLDRAKTIELLLNKVPLIHKTGKKAVYSDTDYMLLGLIIEEITGQRQDEYTENEIFKPLGLKDTMYNPLEKGRDKTEFAATEIFGTSRGRRRNYPEMREYVLRGEVHDEKAFYSLGGVAGHAGLFSTVYEIGILMQVLLNGGGYGNVQLFSQEIIDLFTKQSELDKNFGLGWRRAADGGYEKFFGKHTSTKVYGHTGWTGTVTLIDPVHNLAIALLTNRKHTEVYGDKPFPLEQFKGDDFETGQYGAVLSLIYEALI